MKKHLNLMSSRARIHTCVRTRLWQWSTVLVIELALLVPMVLVVWWQVYQQGQQLNTMEARCEPIRQMQQASRTYEKRIERIRTQEKTALALVQSDTPLATLMGLVGRSVSESDGKVFVEELIFRQDSEMLTDAGSERLASVDINGKGFNEEAVKQLTLSLQSALPFATVQIKSSRIETINRLQSQSFVIECTF